MDYVSISVGYEILILKNLFIEGKKYCLDFGCTSIAATLFPMSALRYKKKCIKNHLKLFIDSRCKLVPL